MAFDIRARISLDGRSFARGMDDVRRKAKTTGQVIEQEFSRDMVRLRQRFGQLFTVSAAVALVSHTAKHAETVRKLGEEYGISAEQAQVLMQRAEDAGISTAKLKENLTATGKGLGAAIDELRTGSEFLMSEAVIRSAERLNEQLRETKRAGMEAGGVLLQLADHMVRFYKLQGRIMLGVATAPYDNHVLSKSEDHLAALFSPDASGRERFTRKLQMRLIERQAARAAANGGKSDNAAVAATPFGQLPVSFDPLNRIGGFAQGRAARDTAIQPMVRHLERIDRATTTLADKLKGNPLRLPGFGGTWEELLQ
jgi:hypothetical protein